MNDWTPQRIVGIVVSAVVIVAAFLPWATVSNGFLSLSINGVDGGSDGWVTAAVAVVALVAFIVHNKVMYIVAAVLSLLAAAIAIYDVFDISSVTNDVDDSVVASVGIGLWLTTFGTIAYAILTLVCRAGVKDAPPSQQPGWPASPAYGQAPYGQTMSGQVPPAQAPPGQMPPGQMPSGQMPPGQVPPPPPPSG